MEPTSSGPKQKQTTLNSYFNKVSPKTSYPSPMEIEPEIIILEKNPKDFSSLKNLPLPHQNPQLWQQIRPVFEAFAHKKTKNFGDFFKGLNFLMSFSIKHPSYDNLETFFTLFPESERIRFFEEVLPCLGKIALQIEILFKEPLKRLVVGQQDKLELSKQKVSCLVVHMFFCTVFQENSDNIYDEDKKKEQTLNLYWNFSKVFYCGEKNTSKNKTKLEKIKCVYNYFKRLNDLIDLKITYIRVCSPFRNEFSLISSTKPLKKVFIHDQNFIENYIKNTIQLDFANKYLGGGVLNHGLVQEEIRYCINPELFPTMLIFDVLKDNEAAIMIGTEQYNSYTGYAESFKFTGDFKDPADTINNDPYYRDIVILAIDAHKYYDPFRQFEKKEVLREINKSLIGFIGDGKYPDNPEKRAIATGRWGCGAFKGNSQLKFLIQWATCSEADRDMHFYRSGDKYLDNIEFMVQTLELVTVGVLIKYLLETCHRIYSLMDKRDVFEIILSLI